MSEYRSDEKSSEQTPKQSPIKQVQTPQIPTKEERASDDKISFGGAKNGPRK